VGRAEDIFNRIIDEGEAAIDEFIGARQTEELFLEFKQSANNGSGKRLHPKDRERLAEAISGFGNSEGGVLVWGIKCKAIATEKRPLVDVQQFVSWIEHTLSGCTVPPHSTIRNHPIVRAESTTGGFVATLIPKSDRAPHQVTGRNHYYIRARPQPHVFHHFTSWPAKIDQHNIELTLGFEVFNAGPGIADDLFLNVTVLSVPGDQCKARLEAKDSTNWGGYFAYGIQVNLISNVGVRLAPEARHMPLILHLSIVPPFTKELHIQGMCGAGSSPPYRFELRNTMDRISELYSLLTARVAASGKPSVSERQQLVSDIFNLNPGED
jgi:hypothetical protein